MKGDVVAVEITCSDSPQPLSIHPLLLNDVNIHVYDNDIYYGSGTEQKAIAVVDSVLSFRFLQLNKFFVKNKTSGSNGRVVVVGTLED